MSTTRDHGDYVFQCDGESCREALETNTSNFEAARNLLRRAGWQPVRVTGGVGPLGAGNAEWNHRCAQCAKGAQLPLARRRA